MMLARKISSVGTCLYQASTGSTRSPAIITFPRKRSTLATPSRIKIQATGVLNASYQQSHPTALPKLESSVTLEDKSKSYKHWWRVALLLCCLLLLRVSLPEQAAASSAAATSSGSWAKGGSISAVLQPVSHRTLQAPAQRASITL